MSKSPKHFVTPETQQRETQNANFHVEVTCNLSSPNETSVFVVVVVVDVGGGGGEKTLYNNQF